MKKFAVFLFYIILSTSYTSIEADKPCLQRRFNHTSFVCVCNSTYCDEIDEIKPLAKGQYMLFTSSASLLRFHKKTGYISNTSTTHISRQNDFDIFLTFLFTGEYVNLILKVNRNKQFQKILGFGGTPTDSSSFLQSQLSNGTRENLMRSYFSKTGIEYNLIRLPITGTDFSLRPYTHNTYPKDDIKLSNFSLVEEDYKYKIPFIRKAKSLVTSDLVIIVTAWGPPPWMKTNNWFGGLGRLRKKYFQTWANYHIRFLEEYKKLGITFWGITPGNEPGNGIMGFFDTQSVGWGMREYVNYLGNHFGPTIRNSKFSYLKILIMDDAKLHSIPWEIDWVNSNEKASQYFDGIATHCYTDNVIPPVFIDEIHYSNPDKIIILTEASYIRHSWMTENVGLGSWSRAEWYFRDILLNLNHWHSGWIDWNLCLNDEGGPAWSENRVDASVIVNAANDEFFKQPMFYAIGHFSKFIPRDSVRVEVQIINGDVEHAGFLRPDGGIVVIFFNPFSHSKHVTIFEEGVGYIELDIYSRSFCTVLYW